MKLLKLTSLSPPQNSLALGLNIGMADLIETPHVINLSSITDFKSHPEAKGMILLYLTNGRQLTIPIEIEEFINILEEL
jgi:hypothetical protein|tara:strand:+ start:2838 stop:3074 length:237 start_codon:yes stop_codon:yes gene_type:complete